jgi:hypothetical protein
VEVPAAKSSEEAAPIKVDVPTGGAAVEIPVENVTPGTVVVIVAKDGTEQVVRTSSVSETGVVVKLESDATVKVVDMSRDFKDVHPVNHWATDAIDFVAARGIFNGTSTDTFTPNGSMTRQAMWMTLARMSGEEPADMAAAREAWEVRLAKAREEAETPELREEYNNANETYNAAKAEYAENCKKFDTEYMERINRLRNGLSPLKQCGEENVNA